MKIFLRLFFLAVIFLIFNPIAKAQGGGQKVLTKKEWRRKYKEEKKYKKSIFDHQKRLNKEKLLGTDKATYKRMKKTRRDSRRVNKNKHRDSFIKRLFKKKRY